MRPEPTPQKWAKEYERLFDVYETYPEEVGFDFIVEKHGSEDFKKYYFEEERKRKALREQGIIVN